MRSWIIHRLLPMGGSAEISAELIDEQLKQGADPGILQAKILVEGAAESPLNGKRDEGAEELLSMYRSHSDPGVHSASQWMLKRTGPR